MKAWKRHLKVSNRTVSQLVKVTFKALCKAHPHSLLITDAAVDLPRRPQYTDCTCNQAWQEPHFEKPFVILGRMLLGCCVLRVRREEGSPAHGLGGGCDLSSADGGGGSFPHPYLTETYHRTCRGSSGLGSTPPPGKCPRHTVPVGSGSSHTLGCMQQEQERQVTN